MRILSLLVGLSACVCLGMGQTTTTIESYSSETDCLDKFSLLKCDSCENPLMRCYGCKPGNVLFTDYRGCTSCSSNCKECHFVNEATPTTACDVCLVGYYLSGTTCAACGTNCLKCEASGTSTKCTECKAKSVITTADGPDCTDCPSNCNTCTMDGTTSKCTTTGCADGYYYNDGSCTVCISNCARCTGQNQCTQCKSGYVVDSTSTSCVLCKTGCKTCSVPAAGTAEADCTACDDGYYLSGTTCPVCLDTNCAKCTDTTGSCTDCKTGYLVSGGACTACSKNCDTCSGDPSVCSACKSGYGKKDSNIVTCDLCPANCKTCSISQLNNGRCGTCKDGYYPDSQSICQSCIANCKSCSDATTCNTCNTGYILPNDGTRTSCTECPANCAGGCSYNATTQVKKCTNCATGFTENQDNTACLACPAGCNGVCNYQQLSGNVDGTRCNCSNDALDANVDGRGDCGGSVYACKNGFYYDASQIGSSTSECRECPGSSSGCLACNATDSSHPCVTCDTSTGYAADPDSNGQCKACTDILSNCANCTYSGSTGTCTTCKDRYYLDSSVTPNVCRSCGTSCKTCSSTSCTTCISDAYVKDTRGSTVAGADQKNCIACSTLDTNCATCTVSACLTCKSGFAFKSSDSSCVACPDNCDECDYSSSNSRVECKSNKCAAGYGNKNDGSCGQCPNFCAVCAEGVSTELSGKMICSTCSQTYAKNNLECSVCTSNCDNCTISDAGNNEGTKAKPGYYVNTAKACQACPSNCLTCSSTGCTKCQSGYGLSTDKTACTVCDTLTRVPNCDTCMDAMADGNATCTGCKTNFVLSDNKKVCNATSNIVGECNMIADHGPECKTCTGDFDLLKQGYNNNYFKFPKNCTLECVKCGTLTPTNDAIATGTDSACNPSSNANYTEFEYCYTGVCAVMRDFVGKAAKGCTTPAILAANNVSGVTTCSNTNDYSDYDCRGTGNDRVCAACCTTTKCTELYFASAGMFYASVSLLMAAAIGAFSLKF